MEKTEKSFHDLLEISQKLRKECPWDAKQTLDTFYQYIVEEAIEVQNAAKAKDYDELKEELGDVFWNILFMANIAKENGVFDLHYVIESSKQKMIRRHPHVFGNASKDMDAIHHAWEEIKEKEKQEKSNKRQ